MGGTDGCCKATGINVSSFFWDYGHLGWGIFAVAVFSGLWVLLSDLSWRLLIVKAARLMTLMGLSWLIGVGIIVAAFYWGAN